MRTTACTTFIMLIGAGAAGWAFDSWDEVRLLSQFKQKVRQELARVPDYTCLETIERSRRGPKTQEFKILDTVRLEVSEVGGQELYAWPGGHFRDAEMSHFVVSGTISTGEFADQARTLFLADAATLRRGGEELLDGRRAVRYSFEIPQFLSMYRISVPAGSAIVGYEGSFWFDPVSLDLLRVDVLAHDIPAQLALREVITQIRYVRAPGVGNALLPERGELAMTKTSGEVSRNVIQFSNCRQYQAESSIRFEAPPEAASAPAIAPVRDVLLPPGLLVPAVLDTAIDPESAAVGDEIHGHIAEEVRDRGQTVLPKDAAISGRIRRVERRGGAHLVAIELTSIEWSGVRAAFRGELVETGAFPGRRRSSDALSIPALGAITVQSGKNLRIPAGLRMVWRTLYPK